MTQTSRLLRKLIIECSTTAGSGHPTSSLSATDVIDELFGTYLTYDINNPLNPNNDRVIFSKGHASPLFYSLWSVAGGISHEEMLTYRKFDSRLEGHPTLKLPFAEAATGSLGQGLSIGLGMALAAKLQNSQYNTRVYNTYVLLGDSEMAEGSNWEAIQLASYYKANNLIAIVDVNRLGQRGETMLGHDIHTHTERWASFGWDVFEVDGHDAEAVAQVWKHIHDSTSDQPRVLIAKTLKGGGISFLSDHEGWHGKALSHEDADKAYAELGEIDHSLTYTLNDVQDTVIPEHEPIEASASHFESPTSVRKAYGPALVALGQTDPRIVVLDAETSNSTFADAFKTAFPNRFFESFIAEQNMVGMALGFARRGYVPYVSTFAAFFSRAYDQIRMSQYSGGGINFVGSHVGVSIGEDGSSQMGLEDIAMFRTIQDCTILYPSDATSMYQLTLASSRITGNVYIRSTRGDTPIIYSQDTPFHIGSSYTHYSSTPNNEVITIITAGITLHEALKAQQTLQNENNIAVRVVDMYSIKPIDTQCIMKACQETEALLVVEDHYKEGGIYETVCSSGVVTIPTYSICVDLPTHSGKPMELLAEQSLDSQGIINKVLEIRS